MSLHHKNVLRCQLADRPVVRIKPATYQPTKADMEKDYQFDGKPEETVWRMFRIVRVVRDLAA